MRFIEADRSTGWTGFVAGALLLAWSIPTLWTFAFDGSAQFVIRNVRLFGRDAVLAAGTLALFGAVTLAAGILVLARNRRGV
jgi:hypothetical protein